MRYPFGRAKRKTIPVNYADIRKEYRRSQLRRRDLLPDPIAQFERWMEEAERMEVIEPTAMSLATTGADGRPRVRTVLLKGLDERGFVFFTNLESRKGRQIAENAQASLLFPWLLLERQVLVAGAVERVSDADALAYFTSRPRGSQLAAWSSPQSEPVESREALESELAKTRERFGEEPLALPPFWGGYRVKPDLIEFWQGGPERLHNRFEYRREGGGWSLQRLAP